MAGGKGGSQTTTVEVPEYIEEAAKRNLARAQQISQIGYTPYYGPDVAAFTPLQEASMQNLAGTAGAFGLATPAGGPMSGMPAPQEFAGGIRGYSSAPMFEEALDELGRRRPAQKAYIDAMFIDPFSGQYTPVYQPVAPIEPVAPVAPVSGGGAGGAGGGGVVDIPFVPEIPVDIPEEVTIVPVDEAAAGDVIAQSPIDDISFDIPADPIDATGQPVESPTADDLANVAAIEALDLTGDIPDTAGQALQYYNPDIDYTDAFQSELTGQLVGTLDPSAEGVAAVQAAQEQLGLQPVDADFYTEQPIYSASDFPLGTSTQGFDYSVYASDSDRQASDLRQNAFGSTVSTGYNVGQVDPALAAAAGYTQPVADQAEETFLSGLLGMLGGPTQPEDMNAMQLAGREAALGGTDAMREYLSSGAYGSATGSAPSSSLSGGATTDRLYARMAEQAAAREAEAAQIAEQKAKAAAGEPTRYRAGAGFINDDGAGKKTYTGSSSITSKGKMKKMAAAQGATHYVFNRKTYKV